MKKLYLKLKWQMWEKILVLTEWLFGYHHPVSYGVKDSRNKAYFAAAFPTRGDKK